MPTYQYACTECGHAFEQFQSFSDDALTVCPECDGKLRKVFNAVGVVFKGSGFYRTDSRAGTSASEPAAAEQGRDEDRLEHPVDHQCGGQDRVEAGRRQHLVEQQLLLVRLRPVESRSTARRISPSVEACPRVLV